MTRDLPSIEVLPEGQAVCPECQGEVRLSAPTFCAECFERFLQDQQRAIDAQFAAAKKRARTWQLGRAVNQ